MRDVARIIRRPPPRWLEGDDRGNGESRMRLSKFAGKPLSIDGLPSPLAVPMKPR